MFEYRVTILDDFEELVNEVYHSAYTPRHESSHHPLVLVPGSQVTLNQQYHRQWEGSTSEVVLPVVVVEDQPYELNRETNPKEHIEFDEAFENLVVRIHLLEVSVGAKELVNLPAKLVIDLPPKSDVGYFSDGDDDGNDSRKHVDWNIGNPAPDLRCCDDGPDFANLNDGIEEEQSIEHCEANELKGVAGINSIDCHDKLEHVSKSKYTQIYRHFTGAHRVIRKEYITALGLIDADKNVALYSKVYRCLNEYGKNV